MIEHTLRRFPGGRRYSSADRAAAREARANMLPATLGAAARAAMIDRDGIESLVDVSFEVESNRLRRTTTNLLLVDGVSVAPVVGDLANLSTGRSNPTHRFAIADGTLADDALTFDPEVGDESSVGVPATCLQTVLNGDASYDNNPTPGSRDRWLAGVFLGTSFAMTRATLPTAISLAADDGVVSDVWVNDSGSSTDLVTAGRPFMFPGTGASARYRVGSSGRFQATMTFRVRGNGRVLARPTMFIRHANPDGSDEITLWPGGWPTDVPGATSGALDLKRVTYTFDVAIPAGRRVTRLTPWVELVAGTTASRVELSGVQAYAGAERSDRLGELAAVVQEDVIVEQTWTDSRRVNRVDVAGEYRGGHVTSASVEVRTAVAGPWVSAGRAASSGRLAVPLDATYDAFGVRVRIEETSAGEGARPWVTEVDPSYVLDVSEDTVSLELAWSRETEPGSSTSPVGNYEASSATLELDNTGSKWNPAQNASLDVGHRIECAVGVRYTNFSSNPVADRDLTDWASTAVLERVTSSTGLDELAPADTAVRASSLVADPLTYAPPVFATAGAWRRVGVWAKYDGPAAAGYLEASLVVWAAKPDAAMTGGVEITVVKPTFARALGWVYVELADVMPAGYTHISIRVKALGGTGGLQTVTATRHYSGGHTGADATTPEIVFEEMFPAGVFYSEPYDTDSTSTTVEIQAVDRLARLKDAEVAEPVRVGQTVGQIVQELALRLLDYDEDQIAVDDSVAGYVIPYSYASGALGSYLADLAKATTATLYVDPLEVLTIAPRGDSTTEIVEEIRADNSLLTTKRPPGYDVTTSGVTVRATPLLPGPSEEVWTMPSGGVKIPKAKTITLVCPYSTTPAVNGFLYGMIADGTVDVTSATFTSDRATIVLSNPSATEDRVVADLKVDASPLVDQPLSVTLQHAPSVTRYGPRNLEVEAKLVQTQAQLDAVAEVLLDTFRALDDEGVRRLPDLSLEALGLLHVTPGDRVLIVDAEQGIGQEYAVVSRRLNYADGAILLSDTRVREALDGLFAIADLNLSDDGYLAGY